jgi:hypothetical protein
MEAPSGIALCALRRLQFSPTREGPGGAAVVCTTANDTAAAQPPPDTPPDCQMDVIG